MWEGVAARAVVARWRGDRSAREGRAPVQVTADRASSKHIAGSRNRGKQSRRRGRPRRQTVVGVEMRTFGEKEGSEPFGSETCNRVGAVFTDDADRWLPARPQD